MSAKGKMENAPYLALTQPDSVVISSYMNNPLAIIFRRRAEIEREMQECRDRLQRLQSELPELDVAERVLTRLGTTEHETVADAPDMGLMAQAERLLDEAPVVSKPHGIPTMPEMILEALRKGQAIPVGMEPRELLKYIAERWWPDVRSELVGPIAWRMWKRGDLVKEGSLYRLPGAYDPPPPSDDDYNQGPKPGDDVSPFA
jgi:hypothetical protein